MIWLYVIGSLLIGAAIGWYIRGKVDEFERDIEKIFEDALKEL
jgi:hypothetical protein